MTFSSKRKSVSSKTKPLCQGLPCQESCRADARLRGWTKDAFRVSGITQVLLCTTSPSSSLRSMPPPLAGEALAFRRVFQQTHISFIENETSLPRAPLPGELARQRLRGWTKDAFRLSGERRCCSVQPLRHLRSRSMPPLLSGEALAGGAGQTSLSRLRRATSPDKGRLCGGEVLSQHRVLLRNEISLSMAPLFRGAVERKRD